MEFEALVTHIRDALTHLYDPAHLQSHPLAKRLIEIKDLDQVDQITRAQKLRRILLASLEQLSPPDGTIIPTKDNACYQALHYRYLDGLSVDEISDILAMSPRQIYRKMREGIEAIASLLQDQLRLEDEQDEALDQKTNDSQDRRVLAQAALQQLSSQAQPEMIDLHALLETIVSDLGPYCNQLGATIQLTLPQPPLYIYADRAMMRQALINLLTSGLDQAAGRALVMTAVQEQIDLRLMLTIRDIEPACQPSSPPYIGVEREGVGLEVAIQLFQMQSIRIDHSPDNMPWQVDIRMPQAGPHHILVIDDMPDIVPLFQRLTSAYACEIIGAENGDEVFALLQHMAPATPSLILLDVMLPRQDGWEILQTLKANPATALIPVVICSILNEPGLAATLGADGYLPKPVSQEALLQELFRWLHLAPEPAVTQP